MIAFRLMAGAVAAGVLSFSAVQAATIINRDTSAHTLRVVEGDTLIHFTLLDSGREQP